MNSLCADKFDEMEQFLEKYTLPKFIQVERDNSNSLMFINEIQSITFQEINNHA